MDLNPRHIDIFRHVALHNGMTRAADALGIGQPFVTRAVSRLESELGFALFLRSHGGLTLTPEGELFLREAERSRAGLEELARAAREIRERGSGMIHFACLPALTFGFVPRVLRRFCATHHGVTLSLAVRSPETIWNWVASQQCDLGLARHRPGHIGLDEEPFLSAPALCALPRGHRLTSRKAVSPQDLREEPMVAAPAHAAHQARIERAFLDAGIRPRIVAECEYTAPRCALVAEGLGFAIVDPLAARDLANSRVVLRRFIPEVPISTVLLFPSGRPRSRLAEDLAAALRDERDHLFAPREREGAAAERRSRYPSYRNRRG